MAEISGFSVISVHYNSSATHYLYARAHLSTKGKNASSRKQNDLPEGRTLFLVNVPPDATERELILFFKHAGTVERILFDDSETTDVLDHDVLESEAEDEDVDAVEEVAIADDNNDDKNNNNNNNNSTESKQKSQSRKRRKKAEDAESIPKVIPLPMPTPPLRKLRRTGRTAHVIFLDASSLERALASTSKPRSWPSAPEQQPHHGLAHYAALYKALRPPLDSIRAFADSSTEVYEHNLQKEKKFTRYKKGEAIVDDDGFTLVTRGGAYGKTLGGGVGVASKKFQRSAGLPRNRRPKKEKEEFYAFQKAEKQRAGLLELRRKWEEDKLKVEKLKASRQFKPY